MARNALAAWALVAAQVAVGLAWIATDAHPAGYEVCEHLIFARRIEHEYVQAREAGGPGALAQWAAQNRRIWTRATLVHLALAPAASAWPGDDARLLAAIVGTVSLVVLARATQVLGQALGGPRAGAVAVAVVALAPGVWGSGRRFGVDLPLAACAAAFAALLVAHPPWRSMRRTAAVGLLAGAACLVKAQFVFWAPGLVIPSLVAAHLSRRTAMARLAVFAAFAAVASAPFWAGDLVEIVGVLGWHATALDNPSNDLPEQWTWRAATYYPLVLVRWTGMAAAPLLAVGGWRAVRARDSGWRIVAIGLAAALVVHTAIALKFGRYLLPAIPLAAALAAAGLEGVAPRWRRALVGIALAGGIALEGAATVGAVPAWTGVDPEICHPPVLGNWAEVVARIVAAADSAPMELVGIEGPPAWDADDFSRVEWLVLGHRPRANVVRRSALRSARDLALWDAQAGHLDLRLVASDPTDEAAPPAIPPGWRTICVDELIPAVRPVPGADLGPPLRIEAWVPER